MTVTTYNQLLDRVISDGIAAARRDYANKPDHLIGAVEGFEECRGKTPTDLIALYTRAEARAHEARRTHVDDYWRWRCRTLEIEWVCNVVSVGIVNNGGQPLLTWLPTSRGAMKYAEIVGVRGADAVMP